MSVERTATFLGRTSTYGYVVTAHQLDRPVELKVDRAFPMLVRCEVDDAPDGTQVAIHATGTPGGFFRWVTPAMTRPLSSLCGRTRRDNTTSPSHRGDSEQAPTSRTG